MMLDASYAKCSGGKIASHTDLRGKHQKKRMRVGMWNVKTMLQHGKLENLKREMEINKINVIGLSKMRIEGLGQIKSNKVTIYYSGDQKGKNGVGKITRNEVANRVQKVT